MSAILQMMNGPAKPVHTEISIDWFNSLTSEDDGVFVDPDTGRKIVVFNSPDGSARVVALGTGLTMDRRSLDGRLLLIVPMMDLFQDIEDGIETSTYKISQLSEKLEEVINEGGSASIVKVGNKVKVMGRIGKTHTIDGFRIHADARKGHGSAEMFKNHGVSPRTYFDILPTTSKTSASPTSHTKINRAWFNFQKVGSYGVVTDEEGNKYVVMRAQSGKLALFTLYGSIKDMELTWKDEGPPLKFIRRFLQNPLVMITILEQELRTELHRILNSAGTGTISRTFINKALNSLPDSIAPISAEGAEEEYARVFGQWISVRGVTVTIMLSNFDSSKEDEIFRPATIEDTPAEPARAQPPRAKHKNISLDWYHSLTRESQGVVWDEEGNHYVIVRDNKDDYAAALITLGQAMIGFEITKGSLTLTKSRGRYHTAHHNQVMQRWKNELVAFLVVTDDLAKEITRIVSSSARGSTISRSLIHQNLLSKVAPVVLTSKGKPVRGKKKPFVIRGVALKSHLQNIKGMFTQVGMPDAEGVPAEPARSERTRVPVSAPATKEEIPHKSEPKTKIELQIGSVMGEAEHPIEELLGRIENFEGVIRQDEAEGEKEIVIAAKEVENDGIKVEMGKKVSHYEAGTLFQLHQEDGEQDYRLSLSVADPAETKEGERVVIYYNDRSYEYQLASMKGRGKFKLMENGDEAGTLEVDGDRLKLQIGELFSIAGVLSKKERVESVAISGKGTEELGLVLDQIARGKDIAHTLRQMAQVGYEGEGITKALSIYNADVSFKFQVDGWTLTIKRRENAPDNLFTDFLEAVLDAKRNLYRKAVYPKPVIHNRTIEVEDETDPYAEVKLEYELPDGSTIKVDLETRGADARLKFVTVDWNDDQYFISDETQREWRWFVSTGKSFKAKNEIQLSWRGVRQSRSLGSVLLTRDYTIVIERSQGATKTKVVLPHKYQIKKVSFVEHRKYQLKTGETISLDLTVQEDGRFVLQEASWRKRGENGDFEYSKEPLSWSDPLHLEWTDLSKGFFERRHHAVRLSQVLEKEDVSENLSQVTELELPVEGVKVRVVWEGERVYSVDIVSNTGTKNILSRPRDLENFHLNSGMPLTLAPFGRVASQFDIIYSEGQWQATSKLVQGKDSNGFQWIGTPTTGGFQLQHLIIKRETRILVAEGLPSEGLKEGEAVTVRFKVADGEYEEYRLTYQRGQIRVGQATVEISLEGYRPMGEDTPIYLNPLAVDRGLGDRYRLPFHLDHYQKLAFQTLQNVLKNVPHDEVLFPTLNTLVTMLKVADDPALWAKSQRLTFVGSKTALTFSDDFLFDPDNPMKWSPAHCETNAWGSRGATLWNGQEVNTKFLKVGARSRKWQVTPPGAQFQSLQLPGDVGFFAVFPVSGTDRTRLSHRRQFGLIAFKRYLFAQAAGMVELQKTQSRFGAQAQWRGDESLLTGRVYREHMTEDGNQVTDEWIEFDVYVDEGKMFFWDGATDIRLGKGDEEGFRDYFKVYSRSGEILFVQTGTPQPKIFRATFLPDANPVITEITQEALGQKNTTAEWLYEQGYVRSLFGDSQNGSSVEKRYVDIEWAEPEALGIPVEVRGDHPEVSRDMLPYLIDPRDWEDALLVTSKEIEAGESPHVKFLELWMANGGGDFQLLPQSIEEFHRAHERLRKIVASTPDNPDAWDRNIVHEERLRLLQEMGSVDLWLVNARNTFLKISLHPHQSSQKKQKPIWVFHPNKRQSRVPITLVGKHPSSDRWIQIETHVVTDQKNRKKQMITFFNPLQEGVGNLLDLSLLVLEKNNRALFALYDSTRKNRDDLDEQDRVYRWASRGKRRNDAQRRLRELFGEFEYLKEIFLPEGPPEAEIAGEGDAIRYEYRWRLVERDADDGATGKYVEIQYPLPHLDAEDAQVLSVIPVPLPQTLELTFWNTLGLEEGASPEKETVSYKVYRSQDETLVLIHPTNPFTRYSLTFSSTQGQEGWPILRQLRGFELGLEDFYSPPQMMFNYRVKRFRLEEGIAGVGRVEEVSGKYREGGLIEAGEQVHRYHLEVDDGGVKVGSQFDVLVNDEGQIVRIFDESWQVTDKRRQAWDVSAVKTEVDEQEGKVVLYFKHRPKAYSDAQKKTSYLTVTLTPPKIDDEVQAWQVEEVFFHRMPTDPAKYYFPSLKENRFSFTMGRATKVRNSGYFLKTLLYENPTDPAEPTALKLQFKFYEKTASKRREVTLILEEGELGKWEHLRGGSFYVFNYHTGEEMKTSNDGELTVDGERYELISRDPYFEVVFYMDEEGFVLQDRRLPFSFNAGRSLSVGKIARSFQKITGEIMEQANRLFEITYGFALEARSSERGTPDEKLAGQAWRKTVYKRVLELMTAGKKKEDEINAITKTEDEIISIWYEACLAYSQKNPGEDLGQLGRSAFRKITKAADSILKRETSSVQDGDGKKGRNASNDQYAYESPHHGEAHKRAGEAHKGAAADEERAGIEEILAKLRTSGESSARELVPIITNMLAGVPLEEAFPENWDAGKKEVVKNRLLIIFQHLWSKLDLRVSDISSLQEWIHHYFGELIDRVDPEKSTTFKKVESFIFDNPIANTGFGAAMIYGLKTFITRKQTDGLTEADWVDIDELTHSLLSAALAVYRDRNEILAEALTDLIIAACSVSEDHWDFSEDILFYALDPAVFQSDPNRFEDFRKFALIFPLIRNEEARSRLLKVLKRPKPLMDAEKKALEALFQRYHSQRRAVEQWKNHYGVTDWFRKLAEEDEQTVEEDEGSELGEMSGERRVPSPAHSHRLDARDALAVEMAVPQPDPTKVELKLVDPSQDSFGSNSVQTGIVNQRLTPGQRLWLDRAHQIARRSGLTDVANSLRVLLAYEPEWLGTYLRVAVMGRDQNLQSVVGRELAREFRGVEKICSPAAQIILLEARRLGRTLDRRQFAVVVGQPDLAQEPRGTASSGVVNPTQYAPALGLGRARVATRNHVIRVAR